MSLTLDDLVSEFLSIEKVEIPKRPTFGERIRNLTRRREIEKQIQDEIEVDRAKILKSGKQAKDFIESVYYRDLIRPLFELDIKGGIQKLIRDGENMTEVQIKNELVVIKRAISKIAAIRLKIIQADSMREENEIYC